MQEWNNHQEPPNLHEFHYSAVSFYYTFQYYNNRMIDMFTISITPEPKMTDFVQRFIFQDLQSQIITPSTFSVRVFLNCIL